VIAKLVSPSERRHNLGISVGTVGILVSDKNRAKDWYHEKLGMEVLKEDGHWVTVGRRGKGAELHLCQADELKPKLNLEPGEQGINLITGSGLDEVYQILLRRGVEFEKPPLKTRWGWGSSIRDPDGNILHLVHED
jgi:catechol 2,3-dioxygenase-like lactoylglutathione lyase family enzyme